VNIIAFLGSPRKGGNTEELLNRAVEGAGREVRIFRLNAMKFRACQSCGGCEKSGVCIMKDEMTDVLEAIRSADRIIVATPIYFMGPSAQLKAMIDRCQAFWSEKYLLKRPIPPGPHGRKGLLLMAGGMKRDVGVECTETICAAFFRTVSIDEHATLAYTGVDAKGDILKHPQALDEAFRAGQDLVRT
jgi:multimeric flavodoxin WrbA